jgi:DNA-binding response OmpR family regulator
LSWALLIVDDDDDIRDDLAAILQARGFHPVVARNGADALSITADHGIKPSVILLDLVMPVMDGVEFLNRQNDVAMLSGVPVIVVTAQRDRARHLPDQVFAVLEKPFSLRVLLHLIEDVCGSIAWSSHPRTADDSQA